MPTTEPSSLTFAETQSVTLEWKLSGLKAIYDSTRGESKSYVQCLYFADGPSKLY
jgi:hypothetical protein